MRKTKRQSALGFAMLLAGTIMLGFSLVHIENLLPLCIMSAIACGAAAFAFMQIFSMRCPRCRKRLTIEPFPLQATPLANFLLWTGLEARCGTCHKVLRERAEKE